MPHSATKLELHKWEQSRRAIPCSAKFLAAHTGEIKDRDLALWNDNIGQSAIDNTT